MTALSEHVSVDEFARTGGRRTRPGRHSANEPDTQASRARARPNPLPPHPADVAQARLFAELLRGDIDELEDRAATAERRWYRRCEHKPDEATTLPHDLKQLRQLIREAHRLLDALHKRFPPD